MNVAPTLSTRGRMFIMASSPSAVSGVDCPSHQLLRIPQDNGGKWALS